MSCRCSLVLLRGSDGAYPWPLAFATSVWEQSKGKRNEKEELELPCMPAKAKARHETCSAWLGLILPSDGNLSPYSLSADEVVHAVLQIVANSQPKGAVAGFI